MPVRELDNYGNLPGGLKAVVPEGFTPVNPMDVRNVDPKRDPENMVDVTGRAILQYFPGTQGPGGPSLADETRAEIRRTGAQTENYLAKVIQPMLSLFDQKTTTPNISLPSFPGSPNPQGIGGQMPPNPQPTAEQLAANALSKQTGRAMLEGGASMLATLPVGGTGAGPAIARTVLGGLGGAAGSGLAESFNPTAHPIRSAIAAGVLNTAAQAVTEGIMSLVGGTRLEPGADTAVRAIMAKGGVIPPGLASKAGTVDFLQALTAKSLGGGPVTETAREGAERLASSMVSDWVDSFTRNATKGDTGTMLMKAMGKSSEYFDTVFDAGYRAADQMLQKATVDKAPIRKTAAAILAEAKGEVGSSAKAKAAQDVLDILNADDSSQLGFLAAKRLRTSLNALTPGTSDLTSRGAVEAAAERLSGTITAEMEKSAAANLTPDGYRFWRALNAAYAQGADTFNSRIVKAVADKDPVAFYNYGVKSNTSSGIEQLRNMVSDPSAWENIQGQYAKDIWDKVTNADRVPNGRQMLALLKEGDNAEKFRAAFSADELQTARELAKTLEITQSSIGAKTGVGGLAMQFMQAGQLFGGGLLLGLRTPGGIAASTGILVGPAMLAKLMTLRPVAKALTIGLRTPPGTKAALNAFSHFAAEATRYGLIGPPEPIGASREAGGQQ